MRASWSSSSYFQETLQPGDRAGSVTPRTWLGGDLRASQMEGADASTGGEITRHDAAIRAAMGSMEDITTFL